MVRRTVTMVGMALLASLGLAGGGDAQPAIDSGPRPGPYEDAGSSFRNILPPGQNGHASGADIARFFASGENDRPPHSSDQLQPYADLVYNSPELTRSELGQFFKDASFGVPRGEVEDEYQPCGEPGDPCEPQRQVDHPCDEVTVQRDEDYGVPHIYGKTRAGTMCAAGYVAGEDRLFLVDALRHAGRAELSEFAGGTQGNREMDREQWAVAPYRERDLRRQVTQADELYGRIGRIGQRDLRAFVDGLNQYRFEAFANPAQKMPGEYAAIIGPPDPQDPTEPPLGPERFKPTDVVAIASLVGGIFGKGGGQELESSLFLQAAQDRLGRQEGEEAWSDFRSAEDPEAPTTVRRERFPYMARPANPADGSLALPDRRSLKWTGVSSRSTTTDNFPGGLFGGPFEFPSAGSNALVVSGRESASGHPLAVFGPQTGYFNPQLLMEMDIHGPGIDARGVSFAGTNLYVQLGRGVDYAWSATSAGQDNVDTFALDLCEPDGSPPTLKSRHYRYRGDCRRFDVLKRTNEFTPNAATGPTGPAGVETLRIRRTTLGLEVARARLHGDPVVYVQLRSTYMHETDSARGFGLFNNPNAIQNARDYQRAAHEIGYTFNWFYVDERDAAYFNSGENPNRADGIDPNFPVRACPTRQCEYEWEGYEPIHKRGRLTGNRARYTPFERHPQTVNQRFLTSWNNKQAPAYRASDGQFTYHSLYRSIPLDERIRDGIRGARTMNELELVDAMEDAGTVDLRGDQVLPWMLKVLQAEGGGSSARAAGDDAQSAGQGTDTEGPDTRGAESDGAEGSSAEIGTAAPGSEDPFAERERTSTVVAASRVAGQVADQVEGEPDVREQPCPEDLTTAEAIPILRIWQRAGAHRRDMDGDGETEAGGYAHSCAIQIMDAWWPIVVPAIFRPTLGQRAYNRRLDLGGIDNEPNNHGAHLGSAYQGGFYGYVEKDLRTVLGKRVRGRYSRIYCGGDQNDEGTLEDCRAVLESTLEAALAVPREELYDDDDTCESDEHEQFDDQYCYDTVEHQPVGAITQPLIHWINRPTFQQVVEVKRDVPRHDDRSGGGRDDPPGGGGEEPAGGQGGTAPASRGGGTAGGETATGGAASGANDAAAAAESVTRTRGEAAGGSLPFTGLALGLLALIGVLMLAVGLYGRSRT